MAGFCHEAVVFGSAFSDARFGSAGAKRVGVPGDGKKHFIDEGGDRPGFIFGPGGGISKLTQGIQAAFERDAAKINFVGEGGLLHDAADEVVGDEVHAQFAFDHVGGLTTQDVHVEMNFDLAEMKLDAPAAKVEVGKVRFENGEIKQSGDKRHALGAKATIADGIADDAHGEALRQKGELLVSHERGTFFRAFPIHKHIKIRRFGELGTNGFAKLFFRQAHERIYAAGEQGGKGGEGEKSPVSDRQIPRIQSAPEVAEKGAFMGLAVTVSRLNQSAAEQAEDADKVNGREAATGLLTFALRPTGLVFLGVGHGESGAVGKLDVAAVPEFGGRDVVLQAVGEMSVDIVHDLKGDFGPGLTVGAGVRTHGVALFFGKLSAHESHDFTNGFATGTLGSVDLIEKAPEDDIKGKDAPATVRAFGLLSQQNLWEIEAKSIAQLRKRSAFGEFGQSFRQSRNRRLSKKQGTESLKKGSFDSHI